MRWIMSATLLVATIPVFAQENEAEKLFRSMEKKIRAAKSLKVVSAAEAEFGGKVTKLKATGQFAEGNKSRIDAESDDGSRQMKLLFISDGKQTGKLIPGPVPQFADSGATKAKHNESLIAAVARAGMVASVKIAEEGELLDLEKIMPLSEFKLGAKERVGAAEAQIVEFVLTFDGKQRTPIQVWIDTKTMLPLKRAMQSERKMPGTGEMIKGERITETYTEFLLDPKLDAKVFELPK